MLNSTMLKQQRKHSKNAMGHILTEEVSDWIRLVKEIGLKEEKADLEDKEDLQEILEIQLLFLVKTIKMLRRDQLALLLERKLHFDSCDLFN